VTWVGGSKKKITIEAQRHRASQSRSRRNSRRRRIIIKGPEEEDPASPDLLLLLLVTIFLLFLLLLLCEALCLCGYLLLRSRAMERPDRPQPVNPGLG